MKRWWWLAIVCGCGGAGVGPLPRSSSIAVSADGKSLYVVNADSDSLSILDAGARTLTREVFLAGGPPQPSADGSTFTPAVMPRSLSLSPDGKTAFVGGQRSGSLYAVEVPSGDVRASGVLCSEPFGVLASPDGNSVFVACAQDNSVVKVDAKSLMVTATAQLPSEPWSLAWSPGGARLLVTHFMGPGVSALDPKALTMEASWTIPDTAARGDKRLAHGQVRGLYASASRPGADELWVAHAMLGTDTAQPELDFESTAFPSLSILHGDGTYEKTLSTDAEDVPGVDGSFADIVSGPRDLQFTADGRWLLLVDANSEDVMLIDAEARHESSLVRPLPGHLPEGIALSPDEKFAYVDQRNTGDVAVLALSKSAGVLSLAVDGAPISRLTSDPMPATLRLGQHLFYSANSDEYPLTKNHWVSCATCHMEGRSDAVTWRFAQGPRDTPSNAGGMIGTGFLFRTADRNQVQDYWHTINVEQGGAFDPATSPMQEALLDALAAYVNGAIPLPVPPTTDRAKVAAGQSAFQSAGCDGCHSGARFTDSGQGNPTLDLAGTILLHDVGTCVTSGYPDVDHTDVDGDPRAACQFDTPSLSGVSSSAPYFHDGSAAALSDVIARAGTHADAAATLSAADQAALLEYLRSL
jgi:YVTN family beta-propeller protein